MTLYTNAIAFIRFNLAIMRATIVPLWRLDQ